MCDCRYWVKHNSVVFKVSKIVFKQMITSLLSLTDEVFVKLLLINLYSLGLFHWIFEFLRY